MAAPARPHQATLRVGRNVLGEPDGYGTRGQQHADAQQLRDGEHGSAGRAIHRQSDLRDRAADGGLHQHLDRTISSYSWTFCDGGTSTVAAPSHLYAAAVTYTVSLTVTGPGGSDTQTRSNYVTVSATTPVAQFTGAPTKGKAPQVVGFTNASTGSITSYAWDFGDGTTSTTANPNKTYSASGVYTVALTVTGPGGSNTKTQTNYVKVTPRAKFSASATTGVAPLIFRRRIHRRRRHRLRLDFGDYR
jgi:chitodextrinase